MFIEADFNISLQKNNIKTTHIHRPLELYINTLTKNNFMIMKLEELLPKKVDFNKFPSVINYPRFLGVLVQKI